MKLDNCKYYRDVITVRHEENTKSFGRYGRSSQRLQNPHGSIEAGASKRSLCRDHVIIFSNSVSIIKLQINFI